MTDTPDKIQFPQDSPLYPMVTAYMAAVCGMLIFRKEFSFDMSVKVGFASSEYPALAIIPQQIKAMYEVGGFGLGGVTDALSCMMINIAYEAVAHHYGKDAWLELRRKHPELDFFRHLRNAASHRATWYFKKKEPSRRAEWRRRKIEKGWHGKPLFNETLKPGDLLVFLGDVQKLLP